MFGFQRTLLAAKEAIRMVDLDRHILELCHTAAATWVRFTKS